MGELGKLVVTGLGKKIRHFIHLYQENLKIHKQKRQEILEPITSAMIAEVEKKTNSKEAVGINSNSFTPKVTKELYNLAAKHIPCIKCNKIVGHIILQMMRQTKVCLKIIIELHIQKLKEYNVETWIIGKEEFTPVKEIISYTKKVWPQKKKVQLK